MTTELRKRLKEIGFEILKDMTGGAVSEFNEQIDLAIDDFEKRMEKMLNEIWTKGKDNKECCENTTIEIIEKLRKFLKERKYKSCPVPRGQYCKKHGVVHKVG